MAYRPVRERKPTEKGKEYFGQLKGSRGMDKSTDFPDPKDSDNRTDKSTKTGAADTPTSASGSHKLEDYENIRPEDSVSQAGAASRSHRSRSSRSSRSSRTSCSSRASIASALLLEKMKRVSLEAEAAALAEESDLMRQEIELRQAQKTLELKTKIAVATAKESVLIAAEQSTGDSVERNTNSETSSGSYRLDSLFVNKGSDSADEHFIVQTSGLVDSVLPPRLPGTKDLADSVSGITDQTPGLVRVLGDKSNSQGTAMTRVSSHPSVIISQPSGLADVVSVSSQSQAAYPKLQVSVPNVISLAFSSTDVQTKPACQKSVTSVARIPQSVNVSVSHNVHSTMRSHINSYATSHVYASYLNPLTKSFTPRQTYHVPCTLTTQTQLPRVTSSLDPDPPTSPRGSDIIDEITRHLQASHDTQDKLTNLMLENQQRNLLPQSAIAKFSGSPLEYRSFIRSYESRVASRTSDDSEKLHYLEQYTLGGPREIVRSCLHLNPEEGYKEARSKLESRYGDRFLIAQAYAKKLEEWPNIRADDHKGLDEFTIFLVGCENAMADLEGTMQLDFPSSLSIIASKLPIYLQDRWASRADDIRYRDKGTLTFSKLVKFIEREARITLNPLFGRASREKLMKSKTPTAQKRENVRSAAIVATPQTPPDASKPPCMFCSNNHALDVCRKFTNAPYKDKETLVKKTGLCFGCLGHGHIKPNCPKLATCEKCQARHPTVLHRDPPRSSSVQPPASTGSLETPASTTVTNCSIRSGGTVMAIVPVKVKVASSDKEIATFAFLDQGSSDCFITSDLAKRLEAGGRPTTISISTMGHIGRPKKCLAVSGLEVCGYEEAIYVPLPVTFTDDEMPVTQDDIPRQCDIDRWPHLSTVHLPHLDADIGLLIGNGVPKVMQPYEVINSDDNDPYAVKTVIGWAVNGPLREPPSTHTENCYEACVNRIHVDVGLNDQLKEYINRDFSESRVFSEERGLSVEDQQFLAVVSSTANHKGGHYQIDLPLKDPNVRFPNNRAYALQRLRGIQRKFRDERFKRSYIDFVEDLFTKDYARPIPSGSELNENEQVWYLPHHGVFHPQKGKIRVVFDCSAKFGGMSLNEQLLQGPDLTNRLLGVLLRFRQEPVAFMADLEAMFHQVRVPPHQKDLLRFLWWPSGNPENGVEEYQMNVHLFGATSSPAVCVYALKRVATDNVDDFSNEAIDACQKSFYMDDCLKSVPHEKLACSLAQELMALCRLGGWRLTKWVSNSRVVLQSIPEEERTPDVKTIDLDRDGLPTERALGVHWMVDSDSLGIRVQVNEKPLTRRGMLSVVSSVYDPMGIVAPFVLPGKNLVQNLCRLRLGWDEEIPTEYLQRWSRWVKDLPQLEGYSVNRCVKPEGFENPLTIQLHHFSDASEEGYGTASYLRLVNDQQQTHCCLIFGKSRVAPLKQMTIPRLELTAATVAVKVDALLRHELTLKISDTFFWTDSTSVLGYVSNETARFHTFVANRVALIRENSEPSQWKYVPTDKNPADDASRGQNVDEFLKNSRWRNGPDFLWKPEVEWPQRPCQPVVEENDPEVKEIRVVTTAVKVERPDILTRLLGHYSEWHKLRRLVAILLRARQGLYNKVSANGADPRKRPISTTDLKDAEIALIKWVQREAFPSEIHSLTKGEPLPKGNCLSPLNAIMLDGVVKVGGRLAHAAIPEETKHPIILPKDSALSEMLVRHTHERLGHTGKNHVLSQLQSKYWIIQGSGLVKRTIGRCVLCRRNYGNVMSQVMADLPRDRLLTDSPPFTNVGVDYFGPVLTRRGRSQVKRYGALFTCLTTRAVHVEMADSLDTSSFINALRRFIARRGQVQSMRSDNGTNLVGAEKELRDSLKQWNQEKLQAFLQQRNIEWTFNAPGASHHGGVWERLIRSTRKIMSGLIKEQPLTDDGLNTLLTEIEAILNSRPLTRVSSNPNDLDCLTPNHLLVMKPPQALPPGVFLKEDGYTRRRWRQIQYLSNIFWKRWTAEYLPWLQERKKWTHPRRNIQVDDVVLIVDPTAPRCSWPLGRVEEVYPDRAGMVRSAKVQTKTSTLVRPISKLCMVLECEDLCRDTEE